MFFYFYQILYVTVALILNVFYIYGSSQTGHHDTLIYPLVKFEGCGLGRRTDCHQINCNTVLTKTVLSPKYMTFCKDLGHVYTFKLAPNSIF